MADNAKRPHESGQWTFLETSLVPQRIQRFLDIYMRARGNAGAPRLEDLPPDEIAPYLADISISERMPNGDSVYRFAGSGMEERMGLRLTGRTMREFLAFTNRPAIEAAMKAVSEIPCGSFGAFENNYQSGRTRRSESLAVPLDGGTARPPFHVLILHGVQHELQPDSGMEDTFLAQRIISLRFFDLGFGLPAVDPMSLTGNHRDHDD